ncbi:tetratricopeptide repeat protein [Kribbella sp. NPDC055071]
MGERRPSLQDQIRARRNVVFVGREEPLALFERNLVLPASDPRRRFVFSVHGTAGVGKTTLVRRWRQLADEHGCATGAVDQAYDVPSALEQLASTLADSGHECAGFSRKLAQYRKARRAVDADPNAPTGISSLLTRSATRIGLRAVDGIPVVGAVTGEIDKQEAALLVDQARAFLARRFGRKHDPDLLLEPIEILSTAFVTDLWQLGERPLVLFVDTFEETGTFLDDWLRQLLAGQFGHLPEDTVLVLSGRRPLDANLWADYLDIRADVELQVFTDAEAHELLAARGVVDAATVDLVLELSGRLPVLVAMLAATVTDGTAGTTDPTDTAVDLALKGLSDPERRAALDASLPRRLDRDTLTLAAGPTADFEWLRRLPFVVAQTDGYYFHPVVRTAMIRSFRRAGPGDWPIRHRALTDHYRTRQERLGVPAGEEWKDNRWQDLKLEETYHDLCASGAPALQNALHGLIQVYRWTADRTIRWARTIAQAGHDSGAEVIQARGEQLGAWLLGGIRGELDLLDNLAGDPTMDKSHRWLTLLARVALHTRMGEHEAALRDLDRADLLYAAGAASLEMRGATLGKLGDYDQALVALDAAVRLAPNYSIAVAGRSEVHRLLNQYDAALADIDRAIALRPADPSYVSSRGLLYADLHRNTEAKADLDRAVALAPTEPAWLTLRADFLSELGRFTEALADLGRVLDLEPNSPVARLNRAVLLTALGRRDEALADFDHLSGPEFGDEVTLLRVWIQFSAQDPADGIAELSRLIDQDPNDAFLHGSRGVMYHAAGRLDDALRDFGRALELDPDDTSTLSTRAEVYAELERFAESLADLDRALELEPRSARLRVVRANVRHQAGDHRGALADLDRAAELEPESAEVFSARGSLLADDDRALALTELDRAIALNPDDLPALAKRAQMQIYRGDFQAALEDFESIHRILPHEHSVLALRAWAHRLLGNADAARRDLDQAVQLAPTHGLTLGMRGDFFRRRGDYPAAVSDLTRAIELAPTRASLLIGRGQTYLAMGHYPAATADFTRAAELEPSNGDAWYRQALSWLYQGAEDTARPLLEQAVAASVTKLGADLPDDVPGRLDALRGLQGDERDRLLLVVFATALGYPDAADRLLADLIAAGAPANVVPDVITDLRELGAFVGADTVAPLIARLTRS